MKKFISTLLIVILALSLTTVLISCGEDSEDGDNNQQPQKIRVVAAGAEGAIKLVGYVGDVEYADKGGIRITFGEDAVYAATSDDDGLFTFYYADPNSVGKIKALDYLGLESKDYDFKAFENTAHVENNVDNRCTVVVAEKSKDFDMGTITANYYMRVAFSEYTQIIPEGYYLHGEQTTTVENDGMDKVKLYVNGELYMISHQGALHMPYIIPGTELRPEFDQFEFALRKNQQSGNITVMEDPTYEVTQDDIAGYIEFRGFPINRTDNRALEKSTTWKE